MGNLLRYFVDSARISSFIVPLQHDRKNQTMSGSGLYLSS
jgi:hypothetical protein